MRWRKGLLAGGAAAVGAAVAFNAAAAHGVQALPNLLGGEEGWFDWAGHRIAFTRRGTGTPLLLVHGIHVAAWSYEWWRNVHVLGRSHVVYTIDLLGFGRSDRPDVRYSAAMHMRLIDDFAQQVIGGPCTLIASGITGAYAATLAAHDPPRYPALVLIAPAGLPRPRARSASVGSASRFLLESPLLGTALFNSRVTRAGIRDVLARSYHDQGFVTEELIDCYYAASHQPGARFAPTAFLTHQLEIDVRGALRRLMQPLLLVWGEQAGDAPVEDARRFHAVKPDLELAIFDPSGSLPHDERASEFNEVVHDFLARSERAVLNR